MSPEAERIERYYSVCSNGSAAATAALLREICHPDVRISVPDQLPYGGTAEGIDAVTARLEMMRTFQHGRVVDAGNAKLLDDLPMVVYFSDIQWVADQFEAQGLPAPPNMLGAAWWFIREGLIEEILFIYYDIGLVQCGRIDASEAAGSPWPRKSLLSTEHTRFGANRAGNPNQAVIERIYSDATAGIVSDITDFFHANITLHESTGLPYGGGDHHGLDDVGEVIGNVVVWCDMSKVKLVAVASEGEHVSVLVASPLRGEVARVLIMEDWHLSDGKVAWYRAYYWDTDAVAAVFRTLKSVAD